MGFIPGKSELMPYKYNEDYDWKGKIVSSNSVFSIPVAMASVVASDGRNRFEDTDTIARPVPHFGVAGYPLRHMPKVVVLAGGLPSVLSVTFLRDRLRTLLEDEGIWFGLIPDLGNIIAPTGSTDFTAFDTYSYPIMRPETDGDDNTLYPPFDINVTINSTVLSYDGTKWEGYEILVINLLGEIDPVTYSNLYFPPPGPATVLYEGGDVTATLKYLGFQGQPKLIFNDDDEIEVGEFIKFTTRLEEQIEAEKEALRQLFQIMECKKIALKTIYFGLERPDFSSEEDPNGFIQAGFDEIRQEFRDVVEEVMTQGGDFEIVEEEDLGTTEDLIVSYITEFFGISE